MDADAYPPPASTPGAGSWAPSLLPKLLEGRCSLSPHRTTALIEDLLHADVRLKGLSTHAQHLARGPLSLHGGSAHLPPPPHAGLPKVCAAGTAAHGLG
jgi:hypothetical protein